MPGASDVEQINLEASETATAMYCSVLVDSESGNKVERYLDGCVVVTWDHDGLREVYFPDGTKITSFDKISMAFIEKKDYPSVEIDVELDATTTRHACGQKVSIAQGGERVRVRVALRDGTALLIRHNTTVTATYNGSFKIVERNKEVIVAEDEGEVTFCPSYAWTSQVSFVRLYYFKCVSLFSLSIAISYL